MYFPLGENLTNETGGFSLSAYEIGECECLKCSHRQAWSCTGRCLPPKFVQVRRNCWWQSGNRHGWMQPHSRDRSGQGESAHNSHFGHPRYEPVQKQHENQVRLKFLIYSFIKRSRDEQCGLRIEVTAKHIVLVATKCFQWLALQSKPNNNRISQQTTTNLLHVKELESFVVGTTDNHSVIKRPTNITDSQFVA